MPVTTTPRKHCVLSDKWQHYAYGPFAKKIPLQSSLVNGVIGMFWTRIQSESH